MNHSKNIPVSNRLKQLNLQLHKTKQNLHLTQVKLRETEQELRVTKKELELLQEELLQKKSSFDRALFLLEGYKRTLNNTLENLINLD
jgi:isopropylmalate/homocitrate/citramalate synthase